MIIRFMAALAILVVIGTSSQARPAATTYGLAVIPSERRIAADPVTGARLEYISTSADIDNNLYFHQRSFLADDSLALFTRNGGLMGYILATGELVRIVTPTGGVGLPTCAKTRNSLFVGRGKDILELALKLDVSPTPATAPSRVTCTERLIAHLPDGYSPNSYLTENSNGRSLAVGAGMPGNRTGVITIDVRSGAVKEVAVAEPGDYAGHVQYSHTSPYLISFAGNRDRLMVIDTRTCTSRVVYHELPGELVTHESWWVGEQIVFCGGHRKGESHVKVLDLKTGDVRIVGSGAWWPEGSARELAKVNWWHACADDAGKWVVADNWHGNIVAFDGKTTRAVPITLGHRRYGGGGFGQGDHPHVGWDRSGKRVIFTSTINGNPDVCIATIPE